MLLRMSLHGQVVGDLAQFMVQNELTEQELVDRAESLDFPSRYFLDCMPYKLQAPAPCCCFALPSELHKAVSLL